jgi:hypothetical protein
MKKNVGTKDANIRTLVAAALILGVFFFVENPYIQIVCAIISAVLAGTAFLRTCPVYHYMHKNTLTGGLPTLNVPGQTPLNIEEPTSSAEPKEPVA